MRPSWDETFLRVAEVLAQRGTCSRLKVGAVLVKDTRIISTGYNGAPAGLRHCDHRDGGDMEDGHCSRAEHAERNALLLSRADARGATMYVTASPCLACARMAVTVGVKRIVYAADYQPDVRVDELCAAAGIDLVAFRFSGAS
jgi:dCMP deaminase